MRASTVKTRFAPSPTGRLHLGNARTALFNALLAQSAAGVFLLRIEDSDALRSREEYLRGIVEDLEWLGLAWQEGEGRGGACAPYRQSQRGAIYGTYFERLERAASAYPCFCSAAELERVRAAQLAAGEPPRYPGTCARLSAHEVAMRRERGERAALRFRVPPNADIDFDDLVRGPQRFSTGHLGDFIIRRADGSPSFLFSNAVDDALMGITHVLRGEDHLANTPRQILLLGALELAVPAYGHLPMIVGAGGAPLSKRAGSAALAELRVQGYLPGAVVNYLARLGHPYPDGALLELAELAREFHCDRLARAPARFDAAQLLFWQRQALARCGDETVWGWMGPEVRRLVPAELAPGFVAAVRRNVVLPADAERWARILYVDPAPLDPAARDELCAAGPEFYVEARAALDAAPADYGSFTEQLRSKTGRRGRSLYRPLRAALTGTLEGPELAALFELMGRERVWRRLSVSPAATGDGGGGREKNG